MTNPLDQCCRAYPHTGVDIMAPEGHPVLAAADGVVARVVDQTVGGLTIVIDHGPDVDGRHMRTTYVHLSGVKPGIVRGARVMRGEVIGFVGRSGLSGGLPAHLHFGLWVASPAKGRTYEEAVKNGATRGSADPDPYWWREPGHPDGAPVRILAFVPGRAYPGPGVRLTYPVACNADGAR